MREKGIAAAAAVLVGICTVQLASLEANGRLALVAAVALASTCMLGPFVLLRGRAAMEPVTYYVGLSFAIFGVSSLLWLGTAPQNPAFLTAGDVTKALLILAVAFVALWLGYFAGRRKPGVAQWGPLTDDHLPSPWFVAALAMVGVTSRLVQIAGGSYGYLSSIGSTAATGITTQGAYFQWVAVASIALEAAAALAALGVLSAKRAQTRRRYLIALAALLTILVLFGLLSGFKGAVLAMAFLLFLVYGRLRHRFPWKGMVALVAILAAFTPVTSQYRQLSQQAAGTRTAADLGGQSLSDVSSGRGLDASQLVTLVSTRLRQIDIVAVVVRDTPNPRPYLGGGELVGGLGLVFVPRFLWPDKPILLRGQDFAREYLGQPSRVRSSIGATTIGDLYRNFSIWGVALGMLLVGGLLGVLGRLVDRPDPAWLMLAWLVTLALNQPESDLVTLAASGLRTVFVALLIVASLRLHMVVKRKSGPGPATVPSAG